ncbi:transposase [Streptomyces sp. NPDC017943]
MAWDWTGTDIGKAHHHTVVLNNDGDVLLSRRVVNDEPELLDLSSDVAALAEDVVWSIDVADRMASLLVNLPLNHEQTVFYLPGLAVNRTSAGYRGLGKNGREGRPDHR